jgi:hypothetical protein
MNTIHSSWNEKRFKQKLQRKSKHTFYVQYLFFLLKLFPL